MHVRCRKQMFENSDWAIVILVVSFYTDSAMRCISGSNPNLQHTRGPSHAAVGFISYWYRTKGNQPEQWTPWGSYETWRWNVTRQTENWPTIPQLLGSLMCLKQLAHQIAMTAPSALPGRFLPATQCVHLTIVFATCNYPLTCSGLLSANLTV
jgi:hypothetical protein